MKSAINTAVLLCLLCSCAFVPPTELHGDPSLSDSQVAIVATGFDWWPYNGATNAYFVQIDEDVLVGNINQKRVEVLPGPHTYKLDVTEWDLFGRRISVICIIDFDAEAGHEYVIGLELWDKYYDGTRHDGAYIWVVDKESGEIIAGAEPSQSLSAPSSDRFCASSEYP